MRQWDDGFLIYDMMDDHSGFLGNGGWLPQQEQELLSAADLVTVVADMLATKARDSKACIIIKNAADRDHFVTVRLRPSGEVPVRVGYYGAISHWFDSALVSESAKAHPEWGVRAGRVYFPGRSTGPRFPSKGGNAWRAAVRCDKWLFEQLGRWDDTLQAVAVDPGDQPGQGLRVPVCG